MKLLHLAWIAVLAASPATVTGSLVSTAGSHTILLSDAVRGERNPFLVFQGESMHLARGSSPQDKNGVTSARKKNV